MDMYRAVGNRCALDLALFNLPISQKEAYSILLAENFELIEVDIISLAQSCIGNSYRRGARLWEAPNVFDCSSFVKWLYGQKGVWLPRRTIQQRYCGKTVSIEEIAPGDLVFTTGAINWFETNPDEGVGHVGIVAGEKTIIHAANKRLGVTQSPLSSFLEGEKFRGVQRIIPSDREILTFLTPAQREVETSDDIKWIILKNIPL